MTATSRAAGDRFVTYRDKNRQWLPYTYLRRRDGFGGPSCQPMNATSPAAEPDEDTEQWGSKTAAKAEALLPAGNSKEKNGDQEVNTLNTDDDESSGLGTFAVSLIVCTGLLLLILLLCRANGDGPLAADRCECHPGAGFFQRYHFVSRCSKTGCSCLA